MFLSFLNALKTENNAPLIESIKEGFIVCFEADSGLKKVSAQEAKDKGFFGPVWHGTTGEKREQIEKEGFKVFVGMTGSAELSHGYEGGSSYHEDIPAPVHHLGYGIYFTTVRAIAKQFSGGTMRGMKEYYLDVPRLETINFGAPRTMMKW